MVFCMFSLSKTKRATKQNKEQVSKDITPLSQNRPQRRSGFFTRANNTNKGNYQKVAGLPPPSRPSRTELTTDNSKGPVRTGGLSMSVSVTGRLVTELKPANLQLVYQSIDAVLLADSASSEKTAPTTLPVTSTPSINKQSEMFSMSDLSGHAPMKVDFHHQSPNMQVKQKEAPHQKLISALYKLKNQFWPRNAGRKFAALPEKYVNCTDRCQWDIIVKIQAEKIIDILRLALSKRNTAYRELPMKVVSTAQGSFHLVFIVKVRNPVSRKIEGWVVKIPGHGTPDRWTADDEYMLTREVETMRLITTYTDVPAAWVEDHSATLDNDFGFPYIVMQELSGKSACDLWYDEHCEIPSVEIEQKRLNCLRSLARHMTELSKLRFDQIGMPTFDPCAEDFENYDDIEEERLSVSKYFVWPYYDSFRSIERGPFPSTQAFTRNALENLDGLTSSRPTPNTTTANTTTTTPLTEAQVHELGTFKFLSLILSHPVFHTTPTTTFALRHSDLDLQNILIDDAGHVTGILDWDASLALPRCIAHASVPVFLDRDFYPKPLANSPFLCWRAGYYRSVYAAALAEAGNPDAVFTSKSHIYQAVFAALYEGGDREDLIWRLLKEMHVQVEMWDVKYLLAKGCKATEEMLKTELWKVLEPEMPVEGLLERVEEAHKEAAVREWMDGFSSSISSFSSDEDWALL